MQPSRAAVSSYRVELHPWMLGKLFVHGSELVNTVVVQDHANSARWVRESDVLEKLNELNKTLSIEYVVNEVACGGV
jgi:hypothetical protein